MQQIFGAIGLTYKNSLKADAKMLAATNALNALSKAYKNAGASEPLLSFMLVKDWMESGAFTNVGWSLNNPGNIMWNKNDRYGSKGPYNRINKTYYSKYPSLQAYVKKAMQVMAQSPGRPIDAKDSRDFVHRLKLNNYFGNTQSEQSYYDAMKGSAQRINLLSSFVEDTNQDVTTDTPEKQNNNEIWAWVMEHKVPVGLTAAAVTLVLILKR
jgi:hypothetical protein